MSRARAAEQGGRTVMLTMRNAVDQTRKVAIEAPQGSTVRDAAIEAGIAQGESFDVFTADGVSVTREPVEDHAEAVLYVGPQKVAGGAMELDEEPGKAVHFVSVYDHQVRSDVVPGDDQTVRQAAEVAGLAPRDGSQWTVFDSLGVVVDDIPAADMIGEQLYVGPESVEAGGGVPMSTIRRTSSDFPSMKVVKGHSNGERVGMISVNLPDRKGRTRDGTYTCVMDLRNPSPNVFVLNLRDGMRHPRVYGGPRQIPGTSTKSQLVCMGGFFQNTISGIAPYTPDWLLSCINHTNSVLNE